MTRGPRGRHSWPNYNYMDSPFRLGFFLCLVGSFTEPIPSNEQHWFSDEKRMDEEVWDKHKGHKMMVRTVLVRVFVKTQKSRVHIQRYANLLHK